jgi:hypothetical protein
MFFYISDIVLIRDVKTAVQLQQNMKDVRKRRVDQLFMCVRRLTPFAKLFLKFNSESPFGAAICMSIV